METEPAGKFPPDGTTALSEPLTSCCSDYTVELSTDTCQRSSTLSAAPAPYPENLPFAPFLPYSMAGNAELPVLYLQAGFPPGSQAFSAADVLALICILRI
jgi:hypothetical protein